MVEMKRDAIGAIRGWFTCVLLIARREWAAYFQAPIGYIVMVLFALLQGVSFWYVLSALADPARPAPVGAVLHGHLGGSVLSMTAVIAVVAAISMRLVAEDKRQGTWEVLLTAPVDEGAVMVGKWLGGCLFYTLTWLPSLVYPLILMRYAPPSATIDIGPIAAAMVGVFGLGYALLAIGVAASAATSNQIIAAVSTTVVAMVWMLAGDVPTIATHLLSEHTWLHASLAHIDMRGHLDALARGLITSTAACLYLGVIVIGLWGAATLAVWGRRRPNEMRKRALAFAFVGVIVVCVNVLAARHPVSWDVSRGQVNRLDARTIAILDQVARASESGEPLRVTAVRAGLDIFSGVQGAVDRLLTRMQKAEPSLSIRHVSPSLEPLLLAELSAEFAIPVDNLRDGGVVVFQRGPRRRAVDVLDMAAFEPDALGVGKLATFRAEEAFASALAELLDDERPTFCHTTGHGELPMRAAGARGDDDGQADWSAIARRLAKEHIELQPVPVLGAGVPSYCRVLIMAGPSRAVSPSEARAVSDFLSDGGRFLLALSELRRAPMTVEQAGVTGLELPLAEYGIAIPPVTVVDAAHAVDEPDIWFTTRGYGAHPVTAGFVDRRLTLWLRPRAVVVTDGDARRDFVSTVLVQSSASGFGETTRYAPPSRDERDIDGPMAVAAAVSQESSGSRIVVVGGAYSVSSVVARSHSSAGDLLIVRALSWLGGMRRAISIGDKTPEQVSLVMSQRQLTRALIICVVAIPGLFAVFGGWVWWRRRRV